MSNRYFWQEACLACWIDNGHRGIVQAVTGAGKTMLALKAIRYLQRETAELSVYVVVPTKALMKQWYSRLSNCFGREDVGCFHGGFRFSSEHFITVCVINSARYTLARKILKALASGNRVLLIADECHHYASAENRKIFDFFPFVGTQNGHLPAFFSLGLSATLPMKEQQEVLTPVLGRVIYQYSYEEAKRDRTVSEFSILKIAVNFQEEEKECYEEMSEELIRARRMLLKKCPYLGHAGSGFFPILQEMAKEKNSGAAVLAKRFLNLSYKRRRLVSMAANRTDCVCTLLSHLDEKRCIIFGESIEQAGKLSDRLQILYPGKVGCYHSRMGDQANRNTLERFCNREVRILITCKALDEGLDIPETDVGIILSGTSMERQRIQRLGRIVRYSADKTQACLYYLYIRESIEEKSYVPERGETFAAAELLYDDKTMTLHYPEYDFLAKKYMERLEENNVDEELIEEAKRCISAGRYLGDWLLGMKKCLSQADQEEDIRRRNYWICMAMLNKEKNLCRSVDA